MQNNIHIITKNVTYKVTDSATSNSFINNIPYIFVRNKMYMHILDSTNEITRVDVWHGINQELENVR